MSFDQQMSELQLSQHERSRLDFVYGFQVHDDQAPLGRGTTGVVYRASYGDVPSSVKGIPFKTANLKNLMRQLYMLKRVVHSHVLSVHKVITTEDKSHLLIFMELAEGGDLQSHLEQLDTNCLSEKQAIVYYHQFGKAFRHMHRLGYAHRNIKPANILLDGTKQMCKVADFGSAKAVFDSSSGEQQLSETQIGAILFRAPEEVIIAVTGEGSYCPLKSDVWSTGVMFCQMLNGKAPFVLSSEGDDFESLYDQQIGRQYELRNKELSPAVVELIASHLEPDPSLRPSFKQIFLWMQEDDNSSVGPIEAALPNLV